MPRASLDAEIAIVGAGPAGASTALFLLTAAPHLRGRVWLIDKASFPREKICAGAIGARADRLLASIGASVSVPSAVIGGLAVTTRAGRLHERLNGRGAIGRVVRRVEFDAALLERAGARGAHVVTGVTVRGLERQGETVRLETSDGELRARAVVGADGVGSAVRRALGLGRGSYWAQAVEVDTAWCASDAAADLLHFDLAEVDGAAYGWDFPTPVGGELRVCRGVYRLVRGAPEGGGEDVADVLAARLRARGLADARAPFRRFAERGLSLHEPFASERVLLVGEAAGIDPVLGEGIAQAIAYGATAARYLARGDYRFADWRPTLYASRVGLDLRLRAAALPWVYGHRAMTERFVARSPALAHAGMCYFAGLRVPRLALLRAAVDLFSSW